MSYKTVLVQVDQSSHAAQRIRIAAAIANADGAHLVGTATSGIARQAYQAHAFDLTMVLAAGQCEALRVAAGEALAKFDAQAASLDVKSYERRMIDDDAGGGLSLQARYADLVVLSQPDPDEADPGAEPDLPEYVMLNCARPVLIVPYAGQFTQVGKNILIAWDGSQEATRAITCALPLLRRAANVSVAVFNAQGALKHGEQPGADIALYLARHQVKVEVVQREVDIDLGNALLSLASELGADLIVMGGYGHTRFRELLLGGVTRTVLRTMTVPVLMAH
jgi:nucleotide-binding universal stress UspA family protein